MSKSSMQKLARSSDVSVMNKDVLWRHPRGFYAACQIEYTKLRFDKSEVFHLRRTVIDKQPAVIMLPYDPHTDQVVMIEQIRPVTVFTGCEQPSIFECCAGLIDEGETPEDAGLRELQEECGLRAKCVEKISEYWVSPGWTTEKIHLYVACVDATGAGGIHGEPNECESIRVFTISSDDLFLCADQGKIDNGGLLIGALWLARHRDRLRQSWADLT